jgi:hypothetical protein
LPQFERIKLNAESLWLYIVFLIRHPRLAAALQFAPWVLGSQAVEELFRHMRASNYVNFTVEIAVLGSKSTS